jgi:hypothetical protein
MNHRRCVIFLFIILILALAVTSCSPADILEIFKLSDNNQSAGVGSQDPDTDPTGDTDNTGGDADVSGNNSSGSGSSTGNNGSGTNDGPGEAGSSETVYISASKLNVRKDASKNSEVVSSLIKGAAVNVLQTSMEEDGTEWYLVNIDTAQGEVQGWIAAQYTVEDRYQLLDENLRDLDFSPQEKAKGYPENPRVKVKGIYVTIYSAGGQRLDQLIEMANKTGINTFVIDVKDDKGYMLFETEAAKKYSPYANTKRTVKDIGAFMKKLKDNGIYTIARIVTFKDPTYTSHHPDKAIIYKDTGKPFTNSDNLIWASPHDRQLWEYDIAVAKEAADVGFNEIQFDYVRFPASDGGKLDRMLDYRNTTGDSKPKTIQNFLKYAYKELSAKKVYVSADIYGLVGSVADDMALGQYWEAISNVVDYVSPMMYPSHYANHTYGLPVPDAYPYETVYNSAKDSVARNKNIETPAIIRPWIQDFTATWVKGYIGYGPEQVKAQIKALEENGIDEFMLWNANNRYSWEAVK